MPSNRIRHIFPLCLLAGLTACQNRGTEVLKPATAAPTSSPDDLASRTIQRRAVEAVNWGMPAVSFDRMYQAMVHDTNAGEGSNKVVYWSPRRVGRTRPLRPTPTRST